ncbi:MAG TPA: hypothetical protein ENH37_10815 [Deltaproteobacteria bacterium]|nr:hypothetical protein [Deltaproteobacteria bacterium]
MLSNFDWLRLCRNGSELIATLNIMNSGPGLFQGPQEIGPPLCGVDGPCTRCWIYPRAPESSGQHCVACEEIVSRARRLGRLSRQCMVVWSFVNFIPDPVRLNSGTESNQIRCSFLPDDNHFLVIIRGYSLRDWLRELLLYHGSELKGLMILFPTTGTGFSYSMGDILCRAIHNDSRFPMDRLRIRFFPRPLELNAPHMREDRGILTFDSTEFLGLLEMATIFRAQLLPHEQDMVKKAVGLKDHQEKGFYWGRLMGMLSLEARDMLAAWKFKQWPENRVRLLYELVAHVPFTP